MSNTFPITKGKFRLPVDHKPFMKVSSGGSSCGSCVFYEGIDESGKHNCSEPNYQQYMGTNVIDVSEADGDIFSVCSDWFRPNE